MNIYFFIAFIFSSRDIIRPYSVRYYPELLGWRRQAVKIISRGDENDGSSREKKRRFCLVCFWQKNGGKLKVWARLQFYQASAIFSIFLNAIQTYAIGLEKIWARKHVVLKDVNLEEERASFDFGRLFFCVCERSPLLCQKGMLVFLWRSEQHPYHSCLYYTVRESFRLIMENTTSCHGAVWNLMNMM